MSSDDIDDMVMSINKIPIAGPHGQSTKQRQSLMCSDSTHQKCTQRTNKLQLINPLRAESHIPTPFSIHDTTTTAYARIEQKLFENSSCLLLAKSFKIYIPPRTVVRNRQNKITLQRLGKSISDHIYRLQVHSFHFISFNQITHKKNFILIWRVRSLYPFFQ